MIIRNLAIILDNNNIYIKNNQYKIINNIIIRWIYHLSWRIKYGLKYLLPHYISSNHNIAHTISSGWHILSTFSSSSSILLNNNLINNINININICEIYLLLYHLLLTNITICFYIFLSLHIQLFQLTN